MTEQVATTEPDLALALKTAMRGFAQSVVILTTIDDDGVRYAMAATAVTSCCGPAVTRTLWLPFVIRKNYGPKTVTLAVRPASTAAAANI